MAMSVLTFLVKSWRLLYLIAVPLLLLPLPLVAKTQAGWCSYVMLWMAFYWMAEPLPLPVTSFLPVLLFPLLGIMSSEETAMAYLNDIGIMIVCSLTIAGAVETTNLHKRIALKSLLVIGTSNLKLLLGFMLVTMFLSMWIPNTASTSIMAPIVLAVVDQMHGTSDGPDDKVERGKLKTVAMDGTVDQHDKSNPNQESPRPVRPVPKREGPECAEMKLRKVMLLSVAYAANIGGTGSLIGTGPNLVLKGVIEARFPDCHLVTFATWMLYNAPPMLICVLLAWLYLQWLVKLAMKDCRRLTEDKIREEITRRYDDLGPLSFPEMVVIGLMVIMVSLWFTMRPRFFIGWADLLPHGHTIKGTVPAMAVALLLFVIPKNPRRPTTSPPIMTWEEANAKAQWGVMVLIGGGMALAAASKKTGLSKILADELKVMNALPNGVTVTLFCFAASLLTEITSNTAVISILLPVILDMAVGLRVHPLYFAMPVTIACSFSFMLPAATPPNAIVYGLGNLRIPDMAKPGFVMNTVCVVVEIAMIHILGFPIFNLGSFPSWADPYHNTTEILPHSSGNLSMFHGNDTVLNSTDVPLLNWAST